jgi:hypothetical protein
MLDVLLGLAEEIVGDDLALVVLDLPVPPDRLHADADVHQLAVDAPMVTLLLIANPHGHQVCLPRAELTKDNHARPRGVDLGLLLKDLVCTPGTC